MSHFENAIAVSPGHADAHNNLGLVFAAQSRHADAIRQYRRAIEAKPDHALARGNLGSALLQQGDAAAAMVELERALAAAPDHGGLLNALGLALAAQGKPDEAIGRYRRALSLSPDLVTALGNLGALLVEQGQSAEGLGHLERALVLQPGNPDIHNNLGVAVLAQGNLAGAIGHYERALAIRPDHANAHANLGTALAEQGRNDEARRHLEQALALSPNHVEAHNSLGNIDKHEGRFAEAMAHFDRAIAIRPEYGQAYLNRSEIKSFARQDPDIASMEAVVHRRDLPAVKALNLHFALAKALEDCGEYAGAFEHMRQANMLKRSLVEYDEAEALEFFRQTTEAFDSELFERLQGAGDPSVTPIFVLGMPRSGSSLIEQILASHPLIYGAGELGEFEATVRSVMTYPKDVAALDGAMLRRIGAEYISKLPAAPAGKTRIVDKLPGNSLYVGLIRLALPNARIIHTMRDPIDTCLSCYSKLFTFGHHYTYDLRELGRFYRAYRDLMAHWRSVLPADAMLDVSYEQVVGDLEGQARRMIEYCGLPWDDGCVSFHKNRRAVKTASSVQVRKPLFRSSVEKWRRYEDGLGPMIVELRPLPEPRPPGC